MRTIKGENYGMDMPRQMLPSFRLTVKDLPEIKDWKVGKSYTLKLQVKQVSADESENQPLAARFELEKVEVVKSTTDEEMKGRMGH